MRTQRKIRIALAGAGMVTRHHLIAWSKVPGTEVVAIFNRTLEKGEERAGELGIPRVYADAAEMLDRERPDALDIAVHPSAHAELALLAADRGVDILCQKPMAPSLSEAEAMVAEVGEKVRFMVHENWRFRPQYRTAGRWIHEGKVGAIREFRLSTHSSGLVSAVPGETPFALKRQPFFADLPRFIILELLIHHLDTARFLIGPLTVSWAVTRRVCPLVIGEDLALIALNAENGAVGTVSGNLSAPGFPPLPQDRLELIGDKGNILFDANRLRLQGEISENLEIDLEAAYQASYDNAVSHFVDSLRGDRPFETDRLDNLETLRLVEAAYRMAKTPGN